MAQKHSASYQQDTHVGLDSVAAVTGPTDGPLETRLGCSTETRLGCSTNVGLSRPSPSDAIGLHGRLSHIDYSFPSITAAAGTNRCFFCGNSKHSRMQCPAKDALCMKSKTKGHYAWVSLNQLMRRKILEIKTPILPLFVNRPRLQLSELLLLAL